MGGTIADATAAELAASLPGRLALGRVLGEGGMGVVYAGEHTAHGPVVVKVMHAHLDPSSAERFRLEGQAMARLRSPHVVRLLDWGVAEERPFLVLERLEGRDLEAVLTARGRLGVTEALSIAADVLRGLASAHAQGVVHRDLKPGNIFLCDGARGAVLLDFGVAKLLRQITGIDPLRYVTRSGATVGTPRYMAPEQAKAQAVDGRADLYSLGVVLFRMVTGEHLFAGTTLSSLLLAHVRQPPRPPSQVVATLPPALDRVVLRALAKEPAERYPGAAAFLAAIEDLQASRLRASVVVGTGTEILSADDASTEVLAARADDVSTEVLDASTEVVCAETRRLGRRAERARQRPPTSPTVAAGPTATSARASGARSRSGDAVRCAPTNEDAPVAETVLQAPWLEAPWMASSSPVASSPRGPSPLPSPQGPSPLVPSLTPESSMASPTSSSGAPKAAILAPGVEATLVDPSLGGAVPSAPAALATQTGAAPAARAHAPRGAAARREAAVLVLGLFAILGLVAALVTLWRGGHP